jgi:hypothetical protein
MSSTRLCVRISNCSRDFDQGGEWYRSPNRGAGALGGIDDLAGGMIQHAVIEGLEPNADILTIHIALQFPQAARMSEARALDISKTSPLRQNLPRRTRDPQKTNGPRG